MSLEKIVAISNKYGANPEFVLAGGGNTSYKDSKYLYVTTYEMVGQNKNEEIVDFTKKIEEGLTNALTNDAYFRNEISRILDNNAYVTETELK